MNITRFFNALRHLAATTRKVHRMDAQVQKLTDAVAEIKDALPAVAGAIDALEAKITAIANSGGMSDEDRAAIAQATDDLRAAAVSLASAVSDANDGIDEAAQPGE